MTSKICSGYAKGCDIIKFIKLAQNSGTNAARNAAIKAATGDYIVILDSDDYFVDDALQFMAQTIETNPEYRHLMFAPDDVNYDVPFFGNCKRKVLTYPDFLCGKVKTGFIHCIARETMQKYPFDEHVRIHEGVFFLSFYREAQKMLFTNRIVTIRERGRSDSVTLDCVRSSKVLIERATKANEMMLERFGEDFKRYGCVGTLKYIYGYLYDNYLLLSEYDKLQQLDSLYDEYYKNCKLESKKVAVLKNFRALHLGECYRQLLQFYLFVKYRIFKYKIK